MNSQVPHSQVQMDLKFKTESDLKPLASTAVLNWRIKTEEQEDLKLKNLIVKNEAGQGELKPWKLENDPSPAVTPAECELCRYTGKDGKKSVFAHPFGPYCDRNFKCDRPRCRFETANVKSLENHVKLHRKVTLEKKFPFACAVKSCDFRRRDENQVKFHEKLHKTSGVQLECELCPNKYPDIVSLSFHQSLQHDKNPYKCELCHCILLSDLGWSSILKNATRLMLYRKILMLGLLTI